MLAAGGLGLGNFDADVAAVGDLVAQRLKPRFKSGHAHGGGSHVHAAAAGAHVQRNANDANVPERRRLRSTLRFSLLNFFIINTF